MSLSERQSITLLAVIAGGLKEASENKMFSALHMRRLVDQAYSTAMITIEKWPISEDRGSINKWVIKRVQIWGEKLDLMEGVPKLSILAPIMSRCLADLFSKVKNIDKRVMLEKLEEPINKIHNWVDPEGRNFEAFEASDSLMEYLYDLIDWKF